MKRVSIQDLKATLSAVLSEAEAGQTVVITRHNEPIARLMPPLPPGLHRGKDVGKEELRPALKKAGRIPYLSALLEDRGDR
jgi:prevent-host-death family protein